MYYYKQAKYSLVDLPYSLKLLWSPLVDVAYSQRIGKRKTWVIPIQFALGEKLYCTPIISIIIICHSS